MHPGSPPVLEAFGQVGLRPGTIDAGEVVDGGQLSQALQRLWREGGFGDRRVRVGVAGLRAIVREVEMPLLPPDELQSAVRFQADEVLPFPFEQTALSFKVVGQIAEPEQPPRLRVLVAGAHQALIDALIGAVQGAGLELVSIDLTTAALVRALCDPRIAGQPEAVVAVGTGLTSIVVHDNGVLQFVRTIDLGGGSITRSIASALDVPYMDAELIKHRLGIPGAADDRARSACDRAVGELVEQISSSIRFFSSLPGRGPVSRIQLTGAGARAVGLFDRLRSETGLQVVVGSPLAAIDASRLPLTPEQASEIDAIGAVAIGLALPDLDGESFNLLPQSVVDQAAADRMRRRVLTGALGLGIVLAGLTGWRLLQVHDAEQQLATLNSQNTAIKTVDIPKYDKVVALRNAVAAQSALVVPLLTEEVDWLVVLNQISQYIPPTATLSNLTMTATTGVSASGSSPGVSSGHPSGSGPPTPTTVIGNITTSVITTTLSAVTTWGQSMSQSPIFTNVDLSGGISSGSTVTFGATLQIEGRAHGQRVAEYSVPTK